MASRKPSASARTTATKSASRASRTGTSRAAAPRPAAAPATRGERRKQLTRDRLLRAAYRLFAERGVDAVPIQEITDAADVGFGSFYNHFASKEAIHGAVLQLVFEEFADVLDTLAAGIDDPAEVLAMSVRLALQRAAREPLWGKLLVRQSHQGDVLARGLGPRLLRDLQRGLARGRFVAPDPLVTFLVVGSSVLGAVTALTLAAETSRAPLAELGVDLVELDVRVAAAVLHVLGLGRAEADAVARRTLPKATRPA